MGGKRGPPVTLGAEVGVGVAPRRREVRTAHRGSASRVIVIVRHRRAQAQALVRLLGGSLVLGLLRLVRVVVWLGFRYDTIPIRTVRSEHAKVAHQRDARRRHQRSQARQELDGRHHQMCPLSTSVFGSVCDRTISQSAQTFESQRTPKAVADQSFSSRLVERAHRYAGRERRRSRPR